MNHVILQSAEIQSVLYGGLIAVLIIILLRQTRRDYSDQFRMPDTRHIHPVTISAMNDNLYQYVYTVLYILAGRKYIHLPENIFAEEAQITINQEIDENHLNFEHEAERTVYEFLSKNSSISHLFLGKPLKAIRNHFKEDKRKVRDLHLMRRPAVIRKCGFLYVFFLLIIGVSGLLLIANRIMNNLDFVVPLILTALGVLFFVFYRRPFDRRSNMGKKFVMNAIQLAQNEEFPAAKQMAYHTALFGYNTLMHEGSATHRTLTTQKEEEVKSSRSRPTNQEGGMHEANGSGDEE